ncbi:hypothetical protein FB451DRAFT_1172132 [Mycena latifolia]|nr:hypothetical protein FB451DRAFT_1172132 [Mycena latifolia]
MAPVSSRIQGARAETQRQSDMRQYTKFVGREYTVNGKNIKLEDLYLVPAHPLRANAPGGRTFIYYADTTERGCQTTWDQEKELQVPMASYETIVGLGYHRLHDLDAVFSRSISGNQDPLKDVIQVWVTGGRLYTRSQKMAIENARGTMLGPQHLRSRSRPVHSLDAEEKPTGVLTGGTAYERSSFAVSVKPPARAYTIGPSVEAPTIMAPVASGKVQGDNDRPLPEQLQARNALLKASTKGAMAAAREAPQHIQEILEEHSDFINKPRTGTADNWAYGTVQTNFAAAKLETLDPDKGSLSGDLATFGVAHVDGHDDVGYMTHMGCCHDVPSYYKPGLFFILPLGVFILLEQYTGINFYGLRNMEGPHPCVPSGIGSGLGHIASITNGTARVSLGALPNNEALIIGPEVVNTGCTAQADKGWSPAASTNRSTFIREGVKMMDAQALLAFVVHNLILFCFYVLQQLPKAWEVRLDLDLFTKAITFKRSDGCRVNTGQWALAPGHPDCTGSGEWELQSGEVRVSDQDSARSDACRRWDEYQATVSMHIPYIGRRGAIVHRLPQTKKGKTRAERDPPDSDSGADHSTSESAVKKPKPKSKKKKAPPPPAEHTDTGVSDSETEPEDPAPLEASAETGAAGSAPPSEKQKGKRKAISDPSASEEEQDVPGHRPPPRKQTHISQEATRLVPRRSARFEEESRVLNSAVMQATELLEDVTMADVPTLRRSTRRSGPSFVATHLALASLEMNLGEVEYACLTVANSPKGDLRSVSSQLLDVETAVLRQPNSEQTPALISGIWHSVQVLEGEEALGTLQKRPQRAVIMQTNYLAWRWLDGYCSAKIRNAVQNPQIPVDQMCWVSRLTCDVQNMLENRVGLKIFAPKSYELEIPAQEFTYQLARPPILASAEEVLEQVLLVTTNIIRTWLKFPFTTLARQQAWFVHALITIIGEDALLLNEVWHAYTHLRRYILSTSKRKDEMLACFESLTGELRQHPLTLADSDEKHTLAQMSNLINAACTGNLTYQPLGKSFEYAAAPTPPAEDIEMGNGSPLNEDSEMGTGAPLNEEGPEPDEEEDSEAENHSGEFDPELLQVAGEKLLDRLVDFLTEAWAVRNGPPVSATSFQMKLLDNLDFLYPFREWAPSRDLEEWKEVVETAKEQHNADWGTDPPKPFFCNNAAFGPSNFRRTIELVPIYFANLARFGWAEKFRDREQVPFLECWNWLRGSIDQGQRFPVLGPLASYLLTADLSYTGAVGKPTLEDIAEVVWDMNKGAASALEILQLISPRARTPAGAKQRADKGEVKAVLAALFKRLQQCLPKAMQDDVGFDVIVLEHALCKFSRALAKNWFALIPGQGNKLRQAKKTQKKNGRK